MRSPLYQMLADYGASDAYAFHMPGHKRSEAPEFPAFMREWFRLDITEIPGFDDLHAPEGILKEAQERAAALYGAEKSFYLVNGSTAGVLAAVSATVPVGGTLLIQRSSHRSAYHGARLRQARLCYLWGEEVVSSRGEKLPIHVVTPGEVLSMLDKHPEVSAVFLTSPGYEGFSADISAIARITRQRGIPLVVDGAHGAHFGMADFLPLSAVDEGADVTVMSLHKTLPAPTQTGLLHLQGSLVSAEKIREFLDIYQTSSPSYPMMAAMDECVCRVGTFSKEIWNGWQRRLQELAKELEGLRSIRVAGGVENAGAKRTGWDPGKLLFMPEDGISGYRLEERLRKKHHLQAEMALPEYVLCISTVMDGEEGLQRLAAAIREADDTYEEWRIPEIGRKELSGVTPFTDPGEGAGPEGEIGIQDGGQPIHPESAMPLWEAAERAREYRPAGECAGRIAGAMVSVYPPGQPLLLPGERISRDMAVYLGKLYDRGANLQGCDEAGALPVLCVEEGES